MLILWAIAFHYPVALACRLLPMMHEIVADNAQDEASGRKYNIKQRPQDNGAD
jgi:hypothetical protein